MIGFRLFGLAVSRRQMYAATKYTLAGLAIIWVAGALALSYARWLV